MLPTGDSGRDGRENAAGSVCAQQQLFNSRVGGYAPRQDESTFSLLISISISPYFPILLSLLRHGPSIINTMRVKQLAVLPVCAASAGNLAGSRRVLGAAQHTQIYVCMQLLLWAACACCARCAGHQHVCAHAAAGGTLLVDAAAARLPPQHRGRSRQQGCWQTQSVE